MSIESQINEKLTADYAPAYLEVENESHGHNVAKGSETHFRVLIVSTKFDGQSRVARQRMIYETLKVELQSGVHALAQRAYTPAEWDVVQGSIDTSSPNCHGGSKR